MFFPQSVSVRAACAARSRVEIWVDPAGDERSAAAPAAKFHKCKYWHPGWGSAVIDNSLMSIYTQRSRCGITYSTAHSAAAQQRPGEDPGTATCVCGQNLRGQAESSGETHQSGEENKRVLGCQCRRSGRVGSEHLRSHKLFIGGSVISLYWI